MNEIPILHCFHFQIILLCEIGTNLYFRNFKIYERSIIYNLIDIIRVSVESLCMVNNRHINPIRLALISSRVFTK